MAFIESLKPTECSLRMHVNLGWIPSSSCIRAYFIATATFCFVVAFSVCYGSVFFHFHRFSYENYFVRGFFHSDSELFDSYSIFPFTEALFASMCVCVFVYLIAYACDCVCLQTPKIHCFFVDWWSRCCAVYVPTVHTSISKNFSFGFCFGCHWLHMKLNKKKPFALLAVCYTRAPLLGRLLFFR